MKTNLLQGKKLILATIFFAFAKGVLAVQWEDLRDQIRDEIKRRGAHHKEVLDLTLELGRRGDEPAKPFLKELMEIRLFTGVITNFDATESGRIFEEQIFSVGSVPGVAEVALAMIGDEETFGRIVERSFDEQAGVRQDAIKKLIMVGDQRVVPWLLNHLEDGFGAGYDIFPKEEILRALDEIVEEPPLKYGDPDLVGFPDPYEKSIATWREWQAEHYPESVKNNVLAVENEEGVYVLSYPNRDSPPKIEELVSNGLGQLEVNKVEVKSASSPPEEPSSEVRKPVSLLRWWPIGLSLLGVAIVIFWARRHFAPNGS